LCDNNGQLFVFVVLAVSYRIVSNILHYFESSVASARIQRRALELKFEGKRQVVWSRKMPQPGAGRQRWEEWL